MIKKNISKSTYNILIIPINMLIALLFKAKSSARNYYPSISYLAIKKLYTISEATIKHINFQKLS